jgi:ribosome-binding protein aMBF1 (putative translation factor)
MNSGFDKHFKKLMKNKTIEKEYSKLFLQEPISTQIAILRRERGLSQKQLADKLHMPQPAIARLERDNYLPNISTLSRLSKVLHCKIVLIPQ